jgi:lysophospholipase L1-like esterase
MSSRSKLFILNSFLIVSLSLVVADWICYSQNTLYTNKEWIVGKRMQKMCLMGGNEYLLSRSPIVKEQMDLSQFHGFQLVYTQKIFDLRSLAFETYLNDSASFIVYLSYNTLQKTFIEIINGSAFFRSTDHQNHVLFSSKLYYPIPLQKWEKWEITVRPSKDGNDETTVTIGNTPQLFTHPRLSKGSIGFRGDLQPQLVRHIVAKDSNGDLFIESFENRKHFFLQWVWVILALIGMTLLILILQFTLLKKKTRNFFLLPTCLTTLMILSSLGYIFDYYSWSRIPLSAATELINSGDDRLLPQIYPIEKVRYKLFAWLSVEKRPTKLLLSKMGYPKDVFCDGFLICNLNNVCITVENEVPPAKPPNTTRIVYLGGSQTYGAGATDIDDTFFALVHRSIQKNLPNVKLESLNIAKQGGDSISLYEMYLKMSPPPTPDILVINIGFNDSTPGFYQRTETFLSSIDPQTQVLLITEPTLLLSRAQLEHDGLRALSLEKNIPIVDMQNEFLKDGILVDPLSWWDIIHLTDKGNRHFAEKLEPVLLHLIKKQKNK